MLNLRLKFLKDFNIPVERRMEYLDEAMQSHGFKLIGHGKHRRGYLSPNGRYVLKFPMFSGGMHDNRLEHQTWHRHKNTPNKDGILYAPCRIIDNFVLMMWACSDTCGWSDGCNRAIEGGTLKRRTENVPMWADYIDCSQVGTLRNGKIVAYDYAL